MAALSVQATATPTYFQCTTETIQSAPGASGYPPDQGYRGVGYDFITVLAQKGQQGETLLSYAIDTNRAATEVRAQATPSRLLESLVATASNDRNTRVLDIRRALFRLLVPIELEAFLGGTSEMVIELDEHTAGIPWELLDTDVRGGGDKRPWAIRAKLCKKSVPDDLRKDIQAQGREVCSLSGSRSVIHLSIRAFRGARSEANAVLSLLTGPRALDGKIVVQLISSDDPDQLGPRRSHCRQYAPV